MCVPVLLIGLLLYNPFQGVGKHSDGLAYQALASHRATVGASELQHYSPVQGGDAQLEVIVEAAFTGLVARSDERYPANFEDQLLPQRPELVASVWFRPPPAA